MATPAHIFRLECDSAKINNITDQVTGVPMALRRGEAIRIQVALFQAGVLVLKSGLISVGAKLVDSGGVVRSEWNNNGTAIIDLNSVGSWRRGHDYLTAFDLTDAQSAALVAGAYRFHVSAMLAEAATAGTVFFANILVDLSNPPVGALPTNPPTPGPPTSWTKGESDARYAVKSEEASLDSTQDALADLSEWLEYAPGIPIKYVSAGTTQAFTDAEKIKARTNINAAILQTTDVQTLANGANYVPKPTINSRWQMTLGGDCTFANPVNFWEWTPGKIYEWMIIQDATGGRKLSWGNLYLLPTFIAIDPQPNSITRLFGRWEGDTFRLWESEPSPLPHPDFHIHAGRGTLDATGVYYSILNDVAGSSQGATLSNGANILSLPFASLNGRPAMNLGSNRCMRFTTPTGAFVAGGCAFAGVFSSTTGGSPQFLAHFPAYGIEVGYDAASGLYMSAINASAANRVAVPFIPGNPGVANVFVASIRAGGGGMALDQNGKTAWLATAGMSAPVYTAFNYLFCRSVANYWNGMVNQVMLWNRALSWQGMLAIRRQLSLEIGYAGT